MNRGTLVVTAVRWVVLFAFGALLWLFLGIASSAHAQDVEAPRIEYVQEGQLVPFDGFLMTEAGIEDWRGRIRLLEEQLELDAELFEKKAKAHKEISDLRLEAEADRRRVLEDLYKSRIGEMKSAYDRLYESTRPSWYENPVLWFVAGVAVTTAVGFAL